MFGYRWIICGASETFGSVEKNRQIFGPWLFPPLPKENILHENLESYFWGLSGVGAGFMGLIPALIKKSMIFLMWQLGDLC